MNRLTAYTPSTDVNESQYQQMKRRELELLQVCVRDILREEFGERFFDIIWSVSYYHGERYPWIVRSGAYDTELWVPGRSAEEACRRFQGELGSVRRGLEQVKSSE